MVRVNYEAVLLVYVGGCAVSLAVVRRSVGLCVVSGGASAFTVGPTASTSGSAILALAG